MIIGDVKGYNVTEISKKKAIKENFLPNSVNRLWMY